MNLRARLRRVAGDSRRGLVLGLACLLSLPPVPTVAQRNATEHELKIAFLFRFAQFTDWPSPSKDETVFCAVGPAGLQEALKALPPRQLGGTPVRALLPSSPAALSACRVLILSGNERGELQRWLTAAADQAMLVVGDSSEAFRAGAVITLVLEPNGMSFRVNLSEAKRRGLTLSSQLLKLAREVR